MAKAKHLDERMVTLYDEPSNHKFRKTIFRLRCLLIEARSIPSNAVYLGKAAYISVEDYFENKLRFRGK